MYIDKLNDIAHKYNNAFHRTIKMKPIDVKSSTCFDFEVECNKKDPKFIFGDHLRISKDKNIFEKSYTPNSSKEVSN